MNKLTKTLAIALAVSVVLNFFVLGFAAARIVGRGRPLHRPDVTMRGMGPRLPAGDWGRHAGALRGRRETVHAARQAVHDALVAEPFQPAALETALAKLRVETEAAQLAFHQALTETVRNLGPEQRKRLAESAWFAGLGPPNRMHE